MNVRLVCVLASSSCIGTELAADIAENVVFRKCDFRRVLAKDFGGFPDAGVRLVMMLRGMGLAIPAAAATVSI